MKTILAALAAATVLSSAANAADISLDTSKDSYTYITITGPIKEGDYAKFRKAAIEGVKANKSMVVMLNSPGGLVMEGIKIANLIDVSKYDTVAVGPCASACSAIWVAGDQRYISREGKIGVHQSGVDGKRTAFTQMIDAQLASWYYKNDVSPTVIGKMLVTPPSSIAWLEKADFAGMKKIRWLADVEEERQAKAKEEAKAREESRAAREEARAAKAKAKEEVKAEKTAAAGECNVTMETYGQLRIGSAYQDAISVFGCDGKLSSSNENSSGYSEVRQWTVANGQVLLNYHNGKLTNKNQFGLQ